MQSAGEHTQKKRTLPEASERVERDVGWHRGTGVGMRSGDEMPPVGSRGRAPGGGLGSPRK